MVGPPSLDVSSETTVYILYILVVFLYGVIMYYDLKKDHMPLEFQDTYVKYIEVWKHGELSSGKQDLKYELEGWSAFVSVGNHRKLIINCCRSLLISIC